MTGMQVWLERYTNLVGRITASSPAAAAALLVDILDDPDAYGLWFGTYSSRPAYADLAMAAMQALANVSSQALFLVEVGLSSGGCGAAAADRAICFILSQCCSHEPGLSFR